MGPAYHPVGTAEENHRGGLAGGLATVMDLTLRSGCRVSITESPR